MNLSQSTLEEALELSTALELIHQEKSHQVEPPLLARLEALSLIETELDGRVELAVDTVDITATDFRDQVLKALQADSETDEDESIRLLPEGTNPDSAFGRFLQTSTDPRLNRQRLQALLPFYKHCKSIRTALGGRVKNRVVINGSDDNLDQAWMFELVHEALTEPSRLFGTESPDDLHFIDASPLLSVDFQTVADSRFNDKRVLFDLLQYALKGKVNPSLTQKPGRFKRFGRWRRGEPRLEPILDQVAPPDHPFQAFQKELQSAVQSGYTPVFTLVGETPLVEDDVEGPEEIDPQVLLEALSFRFSQHAEASEEDKAFTQEVKNFPCLILNPPTAIPAKGRVRSFALEDKVYNPGLLEASASSKETISRATAENLRYHLAVAFENNVEESSTLQSIADEDQIEVEELTPSLIINYFFERAALLNEDIVRYVLDFLSSMGVKRLPSKSRQIITKKVGRGEEILNQFELHSQRSFNSPYMGFPDGPFQHINAVSDYMSLGNEAIGVEQETQQVIEALSTGQSIAVTDTTHFDPAALPYGQKENFTLHKRILSSLIQKVCEADVPDSLKEATIIQFKRLPNGVKQFYAAMGFIIDDRTNFDANSPLQKLLDYNENVVLVIQADEVEDTERLSRLIRMVEAKGVKVLILSNKAIPRLDNIYIPNITEASLRDRVLTDRTKIEAQLGFAFEDEALSMAIAEVNSFRKNEQDPLSLVLQVLQGAATACRVRQGRTINARDMVEALTFTFSKPEATQAREIMRIFKEAPEVIRQYVVGLEEPIEEVLTLVKNHLLGAGNPTKPLSVMMPGPTGVGKTLFIETVAKHLGLPLLKIDGSKYTDKNSLSSLIGSPREYQGESEGVLTDFLDNYPKGIVFFDEFDKFHPVIRQHLMNFFDTGEIQDGKGQTYHRPGMCMLCATNAGASDLRPHQSKGDLQHAVAQSLLSERGVVQFEQTKRFTIVPFLGVNHTEFLEAIEKEVAKLNYRTAYQVFGIRVAGITEAGTQALFDQIKESCRFLTTTKQAPYADEGTIFCNLREIVRGLDNHMSEQVSQIIELKAGVSLSPQTISDERLRLPGNHDRQSFTEDTFWIDVNQNGQLQLFKTN